LAQPFDGTLVRIEPLARGALLGPLSRCSEIHDNARRKVLT